LQQAREEIPKAEWHDALELVTEQHENDLVTIEVVGEQLGDQAEVEKLPLFAIEYDHRGDVVVVAVGGRDRRYPVVLRHIISRPTALFLHPPPPEETKALDVTDGDGVHTIIQFFPQPAT
jgi:hypothetical protein